MDGSHGSELERVKYEKIRHVSLFVNSIVFRNMHEHGALELAIVLRGSGRIACDRGQIRVKPGDMILYNFYEPHEIAAEGDEPLSTLCIQISDRFCRDYYPELPNIRFAAEALPALTGTQQQRIHDLAFGAALDYFQEKPGYELACVGKISNLLAFWMEKLPCDLASDAQTAARRSQNARMRRLVSHIDQHYKEKITLEALAQLEQVTPTHLSHFFRDAFHVSFREYLNTVRLEKALVQMKNPELYLVDICMESGFSDCRSLNAAFLKAFGCSAAEYRKKCLAIGGAEELTKDFLTYANFRYSPSDCLRILQTHFQNGGFRYE